MKGGDCYIDIWRDANFEGESLRLHGPAEFAHLGFEQGNWGNHVGSLRVGPRAFVLAYRDRDFKDKHVTFGPNDEVADLAEWKFDDDMESVRVIDSLKIFDHLLDRDSFAPAPAPADAPLPAPKRGKPRGKRRRS